MKHSVQNLQLPISFPEMELTFADFFCGCGGFSLGFINAGLKCVSAMDMSADAIWNYWYNLCYKGWSHLWVNPENPELKKIKKRKMWNDGKTSNAIFPSGIPDNWLSAHVTEPMPCLNLFMCSIMDLEPEMWMEMCNVRLGDISIFVGGPPCQGFSTCNSKRNMLDERNQLPLRFIYYCKVCKPKIVLMENVPGILTLGKKKGDKEGPFPIWLREKFEDAGYTMKYEVHNAADYGVPQRRKRVFFYAVRKDLSSSELFPKETHGKHLQQYLTVIEAIGHLPPIKNGEYWGKGGAYHAYSMSEREGFVICPQCFHYKLKDREICNNCGYDLPDAIEGGMVVFPEIGMMAGIKQHVDNDALREETEFLYKEKKWNYEV